MLQYAVPAPGSPVINEANQSRYFLDEDILGKPRQLGAIPDLGAYEEQNYGFSLHIDPPSHAIPPGGRAAYTIRMIPIGDYDEEASLSFSPAPENITLVLARVHISPGETSTLSLIDDRSGSLTPGIQYTIAITANAPTASGATLANLLVGGSRLYTPLIFKND